MCIIVHDPVTGITFFQCNGDPETRWIRSLCEQQDEDIEELERQFGLGSLADQIFLDTGDIPLWACAEFGEPDHDWLTCPRCTETMESWLESEPDDEELAAVTDADGAWMGTVVDLDSLSENRRLSLC